MIPTSALYKTPHLKAFNHFDTFNPNSINEAYLNKIVKFSKFKKIQLSNIIWFLIVAITIGLYTVSWIFWILFIIYRTVYINNYAKSKKIILDNLYKLPYDQLIMNIILAKIHGLYDLNSYTGWLGDTEYQYKNKEKILLLSIKVQSIDEINNIEGYEQLKTKVKEKYFKKGEKIMLFREYLASTNLACAKIAFDTDTDKTIETVVINMYFDGHDNNTGHEKRYFISSVQINREIFQKINLEHVSPIHCIRNFAGRIIDSEQKSIMPVLQFDQDDRIIYSDEIIGKDNSDLMEISWEEFETLIRDWLRKEFNSETTKTEVTQASRDGGVDAIVFDTDYLKGGKTVVQVKQYSNVVPVHAARDLWGVMNHENASRGILVTTSHFGPDTYEFTKDKPISLVNGEQLIDYLKKHNFIYKIGKRTNEYHKFY